MRTRVVPALSAFAATAVLALPSGAAAAPPLPFGHACAPRDGALVCPTASDAARVPSFDGVPLDVDVFLPPTGDGPFPTIAMLHGFAGSKADPEAGGTSSTTNAAFYARQGYAVLVSSARGFGRSCGVPDSRTGACARGWLHLADLRFEVRDVQQLLGMLVDEGVARADALGATGISYGGGQTLMLAMLHDRIVTPTGATAPWTSPAGRRLALAAGWARWPWSDLADALLPNGRLGAATFASPIGVPIEAWLDVLTNAAAAPAFVAPPGADPSADLTTWRAALDRGEPYGADLRAVLDELHRFHGPLGVRGGTATPLLIQSGFTDDLFPIGQGLRIYDRLQARRSRAPVALQLGDLGHSRAANHPGDAAQFASQALRFFDAHLKRSGAAPAPGSVTAFLQSCPRAAVHGGGPIRAGSFARLAQGRLRITAGARQSVSSSGGDAAVAQALSPLTVDPCRSVPTEAARGTAIATRRSPGFTLLGRTAVSARVRVRGANAQLVGRLWDLDPATGRQQLVDRGVVRLRSARTVSFRLNGNGWRFRRGHRVRLELLGRDAPTYRASNGAFTVTVSRLRVTLPTRERRPG
jgi:predicted acyl esterase